ncbi:MAG: Membrane alanine aminopeptidase N [uncultured Frankineae bacterium]|uniref:Aminopeptidase N n=1 Tax=uncultured Frankineae bacterium TaxID=437475 RepID=A0A6J4L6F7_9ACTN|nr:MAG: Membrane alanine aminopeptidase N [uncultured Frankineae bacterium]
MSQNNLHRDEAAARARLLTVQSYDVELDLTDGQGAPGEGTFRTTTVVRFSCAEPGAGSHLDLTAPAVHEVLLNGEPLDAAAVFDGNRLALGPLAADNEVRVVADGAYMRSGEGLHRFVDPVDGSVYLYTQFETFDAHRMYACFDQPDLKATFRLTVRAPRDWVVVSNGAAQERPAEGEPGTWRFAETPRMSTYITALVAGPYASVHDEHDGIALGIFCRRSLVQHLDPDDLFTVTKQGFDYYHRVFGYRYPFGKYDQLFVPEFNAGAMENAGAVTFLEDYVFRSKVTDAAYERRAETVLHEMAHMWFGDLVTMRWWDDLWLNESFATYMSVLCQVEATRYSRGWTTFASTEKTWAYRQDQLPSTHPIAADIADIEAVKVNFDGITYAKGASVLKQLVAWVGQDAFLSALQRYFTAHEYGNTVLADLLGALERASGRDLSDWSAEWLETAGVNTLRPVFETDGAGRLTSFTVVQEAPEQWPTLRSHRVAIGFYDLVDGRLVRTHREELDVVGAKTEVASLVGRPQPDLVLVNDDDLTYAKIRLDERSLATLTEHVGDFADSLPRTLCWTAAWDMTRDAEMPARDYVATVLAGIDGESDIGVVQSLLRQVQAALTQFADPGWAPTGRAQLAEAAVRAVHAAEPGSDLQLAWARALGSVASSPEQVALLRGLLDGTTEVPGLAVDTDLRWHLLLRLVALGVDGDEAIEAELARDRTSAGERHAATARALRPTPEAKAEAWRLAVEDESLPNAVHSAVIAGFAHPEQLHLLEQWVEPYFEAVGRVWESRTAEFAQNVAIGLYPALLVSPRVVERTDAYLASHEVQPALARLLLEGRDGIVRALRARERDAAAG